MADMHVRPSGAWKRVIQPHVRPSGAWKGVLRGYEKVSGVWKEFFAGKVTLTNYVDPNIITDVDTGIGLLEVRTDGTLWKREGGTPTQLNSSTDWVVPNGSADSNFDVKWVDLSGDGANSGNMSADSDTWLAVSTMKSIGFEDSVTSLREGVITLSIRRNDGAVIDTGNFEFSVIDTS